MPEYKNAVAEESAKLSAGSRDCFEEGVISRETGDNYVRITVVATVLFLIAVGSVSRSPAPGRGLLPCQHSLMLSIGAYWILRSPRPKTSPERAPALDR